MILHISHVHITLYCNVTEVLIKVIRLRKSQTDADEIWIFLTWWIIAMVYYYRQVCCLTRTCVSVGHESQL